MLIVKKIFLLFFCFISVVSTADAANQPPLVLVTAQQQVTAAFNRLDSGLKKAAGELGQTGITGDAARQILAATCHDFDYAIDCSAIDVKGRIITVEPTDYRKFEGKDISDQEQVKRLLTTKKPVLSSVFRAVEGYDAIDVEYPIFRADTNFIGSISILFKSEKFLGDIIKPLVKGGAMDIWVMETAGRVIYEADPSLVGQNLFTSPRYQPFEQLVGLGREIAKKPQGDATYQFKPVSTDQMVTNNAYWQSVSLYGTDWRLVNIHLGPTTK
jgi:hypothetical protein